MQRNLLALIFAMLVACSHTDEGAQTTWTSMSLPGKSLELIDDTELQWFPFSNEGTSSAKLGTKGGPVAAPILYWRVTGNTLQLSVFEDAKVVEELSDPAIKGDVVSVTRKSGVRARYILSRL